MSLWKHQSVIPVLTELKQTTNDSCLLASFERAVNGEKFQGFLHYFTCFYLASGDLRKYFHTSANSFYRLLLYFAFYYYLKSKFKILHEQHKHHSVFSYSKC